MLLLLASDLCPGLVVARSGVAARRPLLANSRARAVTVAQLASPTAPIDVALLNTMFPRGTEGSEELIRLLRKGSYYMAGDLLDANPDIIRMSMQNLGVTESHQNAICNWHTKQHQETDELLAGLPTQEAQAAAPKKQQQPKKQPKKQPTKPSKPKGLTWHPLNQRA